MYVYLCSVCQIYSKFWIANIFNNFQKIIYNLITILKIDTPIILLWNLNALKLCNATILNGKFEGQVVLLSRIPMIPSDLPISFRRMQFSIR
ncbi:ATP-dependent DNA helicase PIF1-like [Aphis craccivora]|uniref:ATP-dependent DNA helicase PIF1-like n=1 Tax=Aphis craccivora TaxID=307492 RepID=A0A6G0Z3K5_APHCR|nr:ATP-dependent DNA helicase PIF1-like [Aphis craccivora]